MKGHRRGGESVNSNHTNCCKKLYQIHSSTVVLPNISHKKPVLQTSNNARKNANRAGKQQSTCSFGESKINDPLAGVWNNRRRKGRETLWIGRFHGGGSNLGVSRQPIFRGHVEKENSITRRIG